MFKTCTSTVFSPYIYRYILTPLSTHHQPPNFSTLYSSERIIIAPFVIMVKRQGTPYNSRSSKKKKSAVVDQAAEQAEEDTHGETNEQIFPTEAVVPGTGEDEGVEPVAGPATEEVEVLQDAEADDIGANAPADAPIVNPNIVCSIKTPVKGYWRGLRAKKAEKAKSARSICGGCDQAIEKGSMRVQVTDYSFYAQLKGRSQLDRPYLEINIPGYGNSVAARSFWIHEECHVAANEKCKTKFHADWANARALILSGDLVI